MTLDAPPVTPPAQPRSLGRAFVAVALLLGRAVVAVALFFVSGATGLVYEVAWTRRLLLVLGNTSTASSIVLAAFLGGLGLGAVVGGRLAERTSRPLRLYGVLEIAGALWALAVPWLLEAAVGPYLALATGAAPAVGTGLRLLLAAAVVVPGAAAVGATFPAILRALAREDGQVGPAAVALYGANTLGAVWGALWAGFTGIFEAGVLGSTRVAAAVAAGVGVAAIALGSLGRARGPAPALGGDPLRVPRLPLLVAGLSGFVALGLEAAGVRILVFFVEGFTPSFAAMIATFLAGLAGGSLLVGPFLARTRHPGAAVGLLLLVGGGICLATLASLPSFEDTLRPLRDQAYAHGDPLAAQRVTALLGSALLFLPVSLALGACFPLTVRWAAHGEAAHVGRVSGRVYLANSVGSVLGPLAVLAMGGIGATGDDPGGPLLAWTLLGLVALVAGAALAGAGLLPRRAWPYAGAVVCLLAGGGLWLALPAATPAALVRAGRVLRGPDGRPDPRRRLLAVDADETVTASVVETSPTDRALYTDEFAAAATGRDYAYMPLLGHLPVLSSRTPENVLVIAFGTGTTAGAVAAHPAVKRIEIAETSRAVLDLAPWFEAANRRVLADPRVVLRVEDGRNALLHHAADLDVITLEPLMPYTPAALPFYTREFYELARDRLREGGVLCQWIPVHAMPVDLYASLVRTFFETFPDGTIWYFEQSSILLGRRGTARPDDAAVRARRDEAEGELRATGMLVPRALPFGWVASGRRVRAVLDDPSLSSQEAVRASPPGPLAAEVVTDERPFPEAHPAPRAGLRTSYLSDTLLWLSGLVTPDDGAAEVVGMDAVPEGARSAFHRATGEALLARATEAVAEFRALEAAALRGRAEALAATDGGGAHGAAVRALEAAAADAAGRAREGFEAAHRAYFGLLAGPGSVDQNLVRRAVRLERRAAMDAARDRFAREDAARARGDGSEAASARDEALALATRAWMIDPSDPLGTDRPAAARVCAAAMLRAGRCGEAEEVLLEARRLWPWDAGIAASTSFVAARRRGDAAAVPPPELAFAALPPCAGEVAPWARGSLATWRRALAEGDPAQMRKAAESLLAARGDRTDGDADLAAALRASGEAAAPAVLAERAALVRVLAPADPELLALLAAAEPARHRPALLAAARYGFARTGTLDLVRTRFAASPDLERRRLLVLAASSATDRDALRLVAERLDDADEGVRREAWAALALRMPADARAATGYAPDADPAARGAAVAKVLAWVDATK